MYRLKRLKSPPSAMVEDGVGSMTAKVFFLRWCTKNAGYGSLFYSLCYYFQTRRVLNGQFVVVVGLEKESYSIITTIAIVVIGSSINVPSLP